MSGKRVLSLGQCGADHGAIARLLRTHFQVEVIPVDTPDDALAELRRGEVALLLVNRIFDRDGGSGLDFIHRIKAEPALKQVSTMLVSNYEDAQKQATELGALPGFGKAELGRAKTVTQLRGVLGE